MIKIDSEKAIMKFGTGDIGINTYIRTDIDEKGIIFYNQEPRRIGEVADIKANTMVENINDYPVKMVFTNIESIDVVIGMLEELKDLQDPKIIDEYEEIRATIQSDFKTNTVWICDNSRKTKVVLTANIAKRISDKFTTMRIRRQLDI